MIEFFRTGGQLMWILLAVAIITAFQIIRCAIELWSNSALNKNRVEQRLQGILFWAVYSAVFGVFGQILGVYNALKAIMAASDISPPIVVMGMKVSFHTTLFGLMIFSLAAMIWYILRWRYYQRLETQ